MKNKIDYIYEYSDLNLFQTRVQILTGNYAGIILEFGSSVLEQWKDQNNFKFDYALYAIPDSFKVPELRANTEFNEFLAYLLVDIIDDRNHDKDAKAKLEGTAKGDGPDKCAIDIDPIFYPEWIRTQRQKVISRGLQGF